MIEITRTADVPGTPDQVATLVGDLARWPEWFALHDGWSGDVPSQAEVGVRFKQKVRVLGMPGDVAWEVVEVDRPSRFRLKGKGTTRTSMEVDFRIEGGEGGSTVAFTAKLGGLALRPLKGKLVSWVEERADRSLDALAQILAEETA